MFSFVKFFQPKKEEPSVKNEKLKITEWIPYESTNQHRNFFNAVMDKVNLNQLDQKEVEFILKYRDKIKTTNSFQNYYDLRGDAIVCGITPETEYDQKCDEKLSRKQKNLDGCRAEIETMIEESQKRHRP